MKIYLFFLAVIILASCSTAYKSGQTPDDLYFSKAKQPEESVEIRKDSYDDARIRMAARDPRWRNGDDNYYNDIRYYPYPYPYSYSNNYYYPYDYKYSTPKNSTIRSGNLNAYNNSTYTPGKITTSNNRTYNTGNANKNYKTASPNNENRSYTPTASDNKNSSNQRSETKSSGNAVSRPTR